MSESCNHNCSSCSKTCSSREKQDFREALNPKSCVKKVIGIVSGKGGVGKSLVTSLMAASMSRRGKRTAVLDADITGPSIPKVFGIEGKAYGTEDGIFPRESEGGVQVMSINLLLENTGDPVVWRGPVIAGAVKQFWTDIIWEDVDYMFVDMPPGTGDVPLTVFQSLPVDGIVVVTSPQDLVSMIVSKAVKMAAMMNIPVLGLVENMSYFHCPDCGKDHFIFGQSRLEELAAEFNIDTTARIPIDPSLAELCDAGRIEAFSGDWLEKLADKIETI